VPATDERLPPWPIGWVLFGMVLGIIIPATSWWLSI
jgi:hypothetical protein